MKWFNVAKYRRKFTQTICKSLQNHWFGFATAGDSWFWYSSYQ